MHTRWRNTILPVQRTFSTASWLLETIWMNTAAWKVLLFGRAWNSFRHLERAMFTASWLLETIWMNTAAWSVLLSGGAWNSFRHNLVILSSKTPMDAALHDKKTGLRSFRHLDQHFKKDFNSFMIRERSKEIHHVPEVAPETIPKQTMSRQWLKSTWTRPREKSF